MSIRQPYLRGDEEDMNDQRRVREEWNPNSPYPLHVVRPVLKDPVDRFQRLRPLLQESAHMPVHLLEPKWKKIEVKLKPLLMM